MRLRFNGGGGGVMVAAVALLAVAQPRLLQNNLQEDASSNNPVFECYARYLGSPQSDGVLLAHRNHPDVSRYVASVRSSLTILNQNLGPVWRLLSRVHERPYGLLVLLMATPLEAQAYLPLFVYLEPLRRNTRVLAVVAGPPSPYLYAIFVLANSVSAWNVAVLAPDTLVYTHYPFAGGACGQRYIPEALGPCQLPHLDQLYPAKEPRQFGGCWVGVSLCAPPPYIIDRESTSGGR